MKTPNSPGIIALLYLSGKSKVHPSRRAYGVALQKGWIDKQHRITASGKRVLTDHQSHTWFWKRVENDEKTGQTEEKRKVE